MAPFALVMLVCFSIAIAKVEQIFELPNIFTEKYQNILICISKLSDIKYFCNPIKIDNSGL